MSNTTNAVVFKAEVDGKEVEFAIRRPTLHQQREGQKVYNRAFNEATSSGAILRARLDDFMRKQGLWSDEKQEELTSIGKEIFDNEQMLAKGGIKLSEAKKIAISLRKLRNKVNELISKRTELDIHTAEGQADNERFNYWVSVCLVYNDTQKPVFSNLEDYLQKANEQHSFLAASKLAELIYGLKEDYESNHAEVKFLKSYGFIDNKNRFVNKDGHLTDVDGRLVDENGYFVNENGEKVDKDGNLVVSEEITVSPFLDDDGNPVSPKEVVSPAAE